MPLTETSLVVAGVCGLVFFKELRGWKAIVQFFVSTVVLLVPGCILLALFGKQWCLKAVINLSPTFEFILVKNKVSPISKKLCVPKTKIGAKSARVYNRISRKWLVGIERNGKVVAQFSQNKMTRKVYVLGGYTSKFIGKGRLFLTHNFRNVDIRPSWIYSQKAPSLW